MDAYFKKNYTVENFTKMNTYTPDQEKFNTYIKWRQTNPRGTYEDYRRWKEQN